MSRIKINPAVLKGSVVLPPSKSVAHRALICSFLAGGGSVNPIIESNDMKATTGILNSLRNNEAVLNSIESGSTLRFMIPVAAALGREVTFVGEGSLLSRTIGEYQQLLPKHGVQIECNGFLPARLLGRLKNGNYEVNGNVSSQYITGLLMALASLEGDSAVVLKTPLQSKPYVDMTVKVLDDYGVKIKETDFGYLVKGGQTFKKMDYIVEGDWSHSAFFLSAGAIGGDVTALGLDINSTQGDKAIIDVLKAFGADIEIAENGITCRKSDLKGTDVDAENIPDLVPMIAVTAAFANGRTVIKNAERLRYKESNRIESVVNNLKLMGADVTETKDGMIINGGKRLHGAELKGYNDHRIVMAFSVAAANADGETIIDDMQSINKSYPSFFEDYMKIGGKCECLPF